MSNFFIRADSVLTTGIAQTVGNGTTFSPVARQTRPSALRASHYGYFPAPCRGIYLGQSMSAPTRKDLLS